MRLLRCFNRAREERWYGLSTITFDRFQTVGFSTELVWWRKLELLSAACDGGRLLRRIEFLWKVQAPRTTLPHRTELHFPRSDSDAFKVLDPPFR